MFFSREIRGDEIESAARSNTDLQPSTETVNGKLPLEENIENNPGRLHDAEMAADDAVGEHPKLECPKQGEIPDAASENPVSSEHPKLYDGSASETSEFPESRESGKVLRRDPTDLWETGVRLVDKNLDAIRDDLRDKGWPDGPELESRVQAERPRLLDEYRRNMEGDLSYSYQPDIPDYPGTHP